LEAPCEQHRDVMTITRTIPDSTKDTNNSRKSVLSIERPFERLSQQPKAKRYSYQRFIAKRAVGSLISTNDKAKS
jgi:hypothetical protein